jgi:ABC-2 type transport system ATP-binding protein
MNRGVEIRQLKKSFTLTRWTGFRRTVSEVVAVDDISLNVPEGQAVAFIGPNGAGKSTTIKMLTGILHPTSGEVSVLGFTPWRDRRKLAASIGAVFGQRSQLWYHLPPLDTFELLSRIYMLERTEFIRTRDLLIERFNLGPFMQTPVRKLSLGQRMRAEVAASLLHRPRVLFLDEPTIGLDVIARQELRDLICEWNRRDGTTIFLTSHDAGDIEHVAQRVVVINHGRVVVDDNVAAVRRKYLGAKILRVQFQELPRPMTLAGVTTLRDSGYEWTLQVDTAITPVRVVTAAVLESGSVADIAVEDPPLEEVIARIYSETRKEVPT